MIGAARPPDPFDPDVDELEKSWKDWKQEFAWYISCAGLKEQTGEDKVATLMNAMGRKVIKIYNSFNLTEAQQKDAAVILGKFDAAFTKTVDPNYFRARFFEMSQKGGRNVSDFVVELKVEAKKCQFGELESDLIFLQLKKGVSCEKLKDKLMSTKNLQEAINCYQQFELIEEQRQKSGQETIDAIQQQRCKNDNDTNTNLRKCANCGKRHSKNSCPAFGRECHNCKKKNHFASVCRSPSVEMKEKKLDKNKRKPKIATVSEDEEEQESDDELDVLNLRLHTIQLNGDQDWTEDVIVGNRVINFKLDSGAQCNVIPKKLLGKIDSKLAKSTSRFLISYNNEKTAILGEIEEDCKVVATKQTGKLVFKIVDMNCKPILGKESCVKLNLIKRINSLKSKESIYEGLGCLRNFQYKLEFKKGAKFETRPIRPIPYTKREEIKKELDKMVSLGVIKKVEEPTPVVSDLVCITKKGKTRICLDPSDVNKVILRRHYPLKTIDEISANVKGSKLFTKLDMKKGFWQIQIHPNSQKFLTIGTPWGRFSYQRMPFGLASAPELFQNKLSTLLEKFKNVEVSMDDILIHDKNRDSLEGRVKEVMETLYNNGIRLNREKCEFNKTSVKFLGVNFTANGIKADDEKIQAILDLKTPENKKQLRRLLGMINSLSKFISNHSILTEPLRTLIPNNVEFVWEKMQDEAFDRIKKTLTTLPLLKFYDVNKPVLLSVDASQNSVGAVLFQDDQPVAYASKSFTQSQRNYPQIEKECYAVKFGLEKFHTYVYGKPVTVETDHRPLQFIFQKPLNRAPPRLKTLIHDCLIYNPSVVYKKGTDMAVADVLSRDVENDPPSEQDNDVEVHIVLNMTGSWKSQIQEETEKNHELQKLKEVIQRGWPDNTDQVENSIKPYWNFRDELAYYDGLIFKSSQVLIPPTLKQKCLEIIHEGHFGITNSINRARQMLFWIGMTNDIKLFVEACQQCQKHQKINRKEPMIIREPPSYPFQFIASDLFYHNKQNYIIMVDYYSNWFDFKPLKTLESSEIIRKFKNWFAVLGIPEKLFSDNGTQYTAKEFKNFAKEYNFELHTSSPYFPQSNGLAERYVGVAKDILDKCNGKDIDKALAAFRNTSKNELGSPNQRAFSRNTRSSLPQTQQSLKPKVVKNVRKKIMANKNKQKSYFDRSAKARPDFKVNQPVNVFDPKTQTWSPGEVVEKDPHPRSLIVQTEKGKYRRNTKFIKNRLNTPDPPATERGKEKTKLSPVTENKFTQILVLSKLSTPQSPTENVSINSEGDNENPPEANEEMEAVAVNMSSNASREIFEDFEHPIFYTEHSTPQNVPNSMFEAEWNSSIKQTRSGRIVRTPENLKKSFILNFETDSDDDST